jgi:tryptophanyl-tRNA synthetase
MAQPENRRPRVLSGMRPTGKLHLGNLVGALQNWVKLQDQYESYHFVADWHMLTTDYADPRDLQSNIQEMVTDWLAAGLDPEKTTFFVQSRLPEHAELFLILSMLTPLGWLERVPTYKEQLENIKDRDIHTFGFLGYPVLQAADILMYKADYVPVGEDQVAHVELTREIARRFNLAYGRAHAASISKLDGKTFAEASLDGKAEFVHRGLVTVDPVFPEPQSLLTPSPRLPGTDGRKMSKSYDNAIYLSDPPETVSKKLATMITDPARKRRNDPGNPDVCPVFDLHKVFSTPEIVARVNRECRTAEIGCLDCKALVAGCIHQRLAPIQEQRKTYEDHPERVWDVLEAGTGKARAVAQHTMAEVRAAVKLI